MHAGLAAIFLAGLLVLYTDEDVASWLCLPSREILFGLPSSSTDVDIDRASDSGSSALPGGIRPLRSAWADESTAPLARDCTVAEAEQQEQDLKWNVNIRGYHPSSCSTTSWMAAVRDNDVTQLLRSVAAKSGSSQLAGDSSVRLERVVLNIGDNQGYIAASVAAHWQPWGPISPKGLFHFLSGLPSMQGKEYHERCGVCHDCDEHQPPIDAAALAAAAGLQIDDEALILQWLRSHVSLTVYEIEPQPANLELLQGFAESVSGGETGGAKDSGSAAGGGGVLRPYQYAVSDFNGTAQFVKRPAGDELGSLTEGGGGDTVTVPVVTVDGFVAQFVDPQERFILDWVSIDTEGYDSAVLDGAVRTLPFTRVVSFEYHEIGQWRSRQLRTYVEKLDAQFGFDCYLEYDRWLVRLNGGCWVPSYEFHQWSNVVCANRRDKDWAPIFARLATNWTSTSTQPQ